MKTYRAVSNLESEGYAPALFQRSRSNPGGQCDVRHFSAVGDATLWLLRAGGGGVIYASADDRVTAVVQPGERQFKATASPGTLEKFFASPSAAKTWLQANGGGFIDEYDPALAKFTELQEVTV